MAFELKTEIIPVRVTPSQARLLRELADQAGMRVSPFMREAALRQASAEERGTHEVVRPVA